MATEASARRPGRETRITGAAGESLAARFLDEQGMRVLERNYRALCGEIDIVAMDGDVLIFCEVKTRRDLEFGPPESAVTPRKQRQMRRAAAAYLYEHGMREHRCRFDVVAILLRGAGPEITYFKNAFFF